jgi:hypothetical protein
MFGCVLEIPTDKVNQTLNPFENIEFSNLISTGKDGLSALSFV